MHARPAEHDVRMVSSRLWVGRPHAALLLVALNAQIFVAYRVAASDSDQGWFLLVHLLALVCAAPVGIAYLFASAGTVTIAGRLLGGRARAADVRSALAWGSVPSAIVGLPGLMALYASIWQSGTRGALMLPTFGVVPGVYQVALFASSCLATSLLARTFGFGHFRAVFAGLLGNLLFALPIVAAVLLLASS